MCDNISGNVASVQAAKKVKYGHISEMDSNSDAATKLGVAAGLKVAEI